VLGRGQHAFFARQLRVKRDFTAQPRVLRIGPEHELIDGQVVRLRRALQAR
jgi:hypothetical protein